MCLRRAAVVANPEKGRALAAKEAFVNNSGSERDRWWPANNSGVGDRRPLQDRAKIEFEAKRRDVNAELLANDCAALCDAEVWAGRLCECLPFFATGLIGPAGLMCAARGRHRANVPEVQLGFERHQGRARKPHGHQP